MISLSTFAVYILTVLVQVQQKITKMQQVYVQHIRYLLRVEFTILKLKLSAKAEMGKLIFVHTHTVTHTTVLQPFSGTIQVSRCQKKSSSGLYCAKEDIRGRHTDNLVGRHFMRPTFLIVPIFMPDALLATTFPIYPGLGQAPNMLALLGYDISVIVNMTLKWN